MPNSVTAPTSPKILKKTHFLLGAATAALALSPAALFAAVHNVTTVTTLRSALANCASGDEIVIAAGTYAPTTTTTPSLKTLDNVTTTAVMFQIANKSNVIIRGATSTNKPVLRAISVTDGNYVFYAQNAPGLIIRDLKIETGDKGMIIDRCSNVTVERVDFRNIGWEALHFRDGSKNARIKNNTLQLIGMARNDRGEGVYIGSDNDKWHPSSYVAGTSYYQPGCDGAIIENNTFGPNIGGEAIDVKEGVTGTIIRNNTFNGALTNTTLINSTAEKANSIIDNKGAQTVIMGNSFNMGGNTFLASAIESFAPIKSTYTPNTGYNIWGFRGFYTNNTVTGDSATQYVVQVLSYGGAKIGGNTKSVGTTLYFIGSKATPNVTYLTGAACNTPNP